MRFHSALGLSLLLVTGIACREEAPTFSKQQQASASEPIYGDNDALSDLGDDPMGDDSDTANTKDPDPEAVPAVTHKTSDAPLADENEESTSLTENSALPAKFDPALGSIYLASRNGRIEKGLKFAIYFTLVNNGSVDGEVKFTPTLTSNVFAEFDNVSLGTQNVKIPAGKSVKIFFDVPVFLQDPATQENFAIGAGRYEVRSTFEFGKEKRQGKTWFFYVGDSNAVLTLVLYEKNYFQSGDAVGANPEAWMKETFTRKSSLYDPATKQKKVYAGGFDEMMNIRHMFKMAEISLADLPPNTQRPDQVKLLATKWLGKSSFWNNAITRENRHGYDYAIGLFNAGFGGVQIGKVTAVSNGIPGDRSKGRMQILIAHESGHLFGAPHCNPEDGYVMCSGEHNAAYKTDKEFVWHKSSFDRMRNIFPVQPK